MHRDPRDMKSVVVAVVTAALAACAVPQPEPQPLPEVAPNLEERLARYAPTELRVDLESLSDEELEVLGHLSEAAAMMDEIFLRQAGEGNAALRDLLDAADAPEALRTYYRINYGPWDRIDEMEPYLGDEPHPAGAGYYPTDMTAEEFETWIEQNPGDAEAFRSLFTVIRRTDSGLEAIPYSVAYGEWLEPAAESLRQAAAATTNESLRRFLESRADAFGSDDYYESDRAWMDLDATVEVTIGPYETYEDGLFGYKAAFESFITINSPEESAALEGYKQQLPWLERNLPIPDEHKNLDRGTESPMRVVDVYQTSGDTRAGIQTIAFNLPNDERVREEKGSKKVMLRNVIQAKYDKVLVPIARLVLAPEAAGRVSFDAYFNEVVHHELSHGLGPGKITVNGRETEVRLELKEHYSVLEEAKADVMGIYNILALIERGDMPAELRGALEPTYVAGLFRSARFGVHEAHGRGVITQFNYLMEKGALSFDDDGLFVLDSEAFPGAIESLLHEMLMLEATGDYEGTKKFLETYGEPGEPLLAGFERLAAVPVDVLPIYPQAEGTEGRP